MIRIPWVGFKQRILEILARMCVFVTGFLPLQLWLLIRERTVMVRRMDYARHPILMCVDSWIENDYRLHSCKKEPETVEWIEKWFKPGDVFYDIGANVGAYSLVAFKALLGNIVIYSFEPGFTNFPQLCRNIHLNDANQAIFPFPVALSDRTSITNFHYQNLTPGGALHALGAPTDQNGKQFHPVCTLPALSYSLDHFVCQFELPFPNHIKIDVDGIECQILKGAQETLCRPELRSILVEDVNQEQQGTDEIAKLLMNSGLVLHRRQGFNSLYFR